MIESKKVLVIVGPTASGKTNLSISLAKFLDGEIISADSMQVYTQMNIGTAKPSIEEMKSVPHHMIDFWDPKKKFSVAQYVSLAREGIKDVLSRNKLPIICGGTGLYIDSLLQNVNFEESKVNYDIRESLLERGRRLGGQVLIEELAQFDPETAKTLHPNNLKRIVRAIEIYRTTGITMSEQIARSKLVPSEYDPVFVGLCYKDRNVLYEKINSRVDEMIDKGLENEARQILKSGFEVTALGAIGYKEMFSYINGDCSLESAIDNIKRSTRRYAKRQMTWFKRNQSINWICVDEFQSFDQILIKAKKIFNENF